MNTTTDHVIFGTGAIGLATLDALRRRGESVRLVNRSGSAPVPDDVEVVGGDATDPEFTTAVAKGARVVYQTLNPPYSRWLEEFPALQTGVLAAAEAGGAAAGEHGERVHVRSPSRATADRDPHYAAHTKKGKLRTDWDRFVREGADRGVLPGHPAALRPPGTGSARRPSWLSSPSRW